MAVNKCTNQTLHLPSHAWSFSRFLISANGTTSRPVMQARRPQSGRRSPLTRPPLSPTSSPPTRVHVSHMYHHHQGPPPWPTVPTLGALPPADSHTAAAVTLPKGDLVSRLLPLPPLELSPRYGCDGPRGRLCLTGLHCPLSPRRPSAGTLNSPYSLAHGASAEGAPGLAQSSPPPPPPSQGAFILDIAQHSHLLGAPLTSLTSTQHYRLKSPVITVGPPLPPECESTMKAGGAVSVAAQLGSLNI